MGTRLDIFHIFHVGRGRANCAELQGEEKLSFSGLEWISNTLKQLPRRISGSIQNYHSQSAYQSMHRPHSRPGRFNMLALQAGRGEGNAPISVFLKEATPGPTRRIDEGYLYTRWSNPTVDAAAQALNELEGGEGTLIFSSGMAAISTALLATLHAGDHVVAPKVVYSGTLHLIKNVLPMYGIEVSLVGAGNNGDLIQAYKDAVKENTKVLYGETPCNPMMTILDLEEFGRLGKSLGNSIVTMVDSTFASPFIQNPIRHGVDIVIHSCSKYIGGHSDIIAGSITAAKSELERKIYETQKILGGCLSPLDGFLLLRGIKTLHIRMERHSTNAMEIAAFLQDHPKVTRVNYPGLPTHPHHSLAKKQMKHFGGMLCFEVKGGLAEATTFVESLKVIKLAVSLGGTDSLAEVVSAMTHTDKYMTPEMREDGGVKDSLVRLSVGLEHVEDLKKDIQQALEKIL